MVIGEWHLIGYSLMFGILEYGPVTRRDHEPARLYDSRTRSRVRTSRYIAYDGFAGCVLSILVLAPFIVLLK